MASMDEEERLKAEIAKLSGAIQTHKEQQQHHPPPFRTFNAGYASRGRGSYTGSGSSSYRGAYNAARGGYHATSATARGRGRGTATIPPRNRTLILNDSNNRSIPPQGTSAASATEKASDDASKPTEATTSTAPTEGWIKRKSTHNMSLVSTSTFQRTEPARLAALEATRKAKAKAQATSSHANKSSRAKSAKASSSVRRGDNMGEVVIDGVVFEFDPSGTKLVKKAIQPSSSPDPSLEGTSSTSSNTTTVTNTAVPLKTSINGQDYIRTKRGNLISAQLLAKRRAQRETQAKKNRLDKMVGQISAIQATRNAASSRTKPTSLTLDAKKARTLCTFFNKTGQCKRGLSCPYLHDSSKIALCPKVLRPSGCNLPKGTCPLSHTIRSERVPHCVHYLRTGKCRNGEECLYTHADLIDGVRTKICRNFSDYGWCEKGKGCEERHTYECPDFVEKGKCDRKGCKLVHVIRSQISSVEDEMEKQEDGDLFMRDDVAAVEEEENGEGEEMERKGKRKRPLMQTELDQDQDQDQQILPDDIDAEHEEQINFADQEDSRRIKKRKAKAFTQQKDFISFNDDEDEDQSEDLDTISDEDQNDDDHLEMGSVHSEDFEFTDVESEDEDRFEGKEDEKEDGEERSRDEIKYQMEEQDNNDDDDDDDDLVDRDL